VPPRLGRQRGDTAIGIQNAGIALVNSHRVIRQLELWKALKHRRAVELFELDTQRSERGAGSFERGRPRQRVIQPAGLEQQLSARLVFQRAPERKSRLRQSHIIRRIVGQPENARVAVRTAALMPDRELLQQQHPSPALRQMVGAGTAHHPAPNDDHVVVRHTLPFSQS